MKCAAPLMLLLLLITGFGGGATAGDNAQTFVAAMKAYKAEDYPAAIDLLEAITATGIENGLLYYNLGNAYLKNNDLGHAILWYARAKQLLPNDPDLRFNYDYAFTLTRDASEGEATPLVRILFFWKFQLSPHTVVTLSIFFCTLFWSLAIAWRLTGRRGLRAALQLALLPALIFILTAGFNYYEARHRNQAIVLPEQIAVRSGLETTSTELFILHAGARVRILKERNGHHQIRFSAQKIGWLPADAVGRI